MEQVKALNALEPFLVLTKSATSPRVAADLVTRATSAPGTYVFAELLQAPQIQALAQAAELASYLTILQIFSYGTYADYTATPNLPSLNEQQTQKLRQLSLLTLAKDPHNLSYASLQRSLGLADARTLEDLVISTIYAELIKAQLDPHNQTVHISSVSPLRDLAPNSIPSMLSSLQAWSDRCTSTLADLEAQIAAIKDAAEKRYDERLTWEARTNTLKEEEQRAEKNGGAHSARGGQMLNRAVASIRGARIGKRGSGSLDADADDDEAMDLDDEDWQDEVGEGVSGGKKRASRRKL